MRSYLHAVRVARQQVRLQPDTSLARHVSAHIPSSDRAGADTLSSPLVRARAEPMESSEDGFDLDAAGTCIPRPIAEFGSVLREARRHPSSHANDVLVWPSVLGPRSSARPKIISHDAHPDQPSSSDSPAEVGTRAADSHCTAGPCMPCPVTSSREADTWASALEADALALATRFPGGRTFWIESGADEGDGARENCSGGCSNESAAGTAPRCTLERLALSVLRFHSKRLAAVWNGEAQHELPAAIGAEWWIQRRILDRDPGEGGIRLHWDCDEQWLRWEHVPPILATVTYVTQGSAPTIVLPLGARADGQAEIPMPSARCCRGGRINTLPEKGHCQHMSRAFNDGDSWKRGGHKTSHVGSQAEGESRAGARGACRRDTSGAHGMCMHGECESDPGHAAACLLESRRFPLTSVCGRAVVCHPRPGKHLAFDGRLLHGALVELQRTEPHLVVAPASRSLDVAGAGRTVARSDGDAACSADPLPTSIASSPVRVTILVNLWPYRPLGLTRLPADVASTLSNGDFFRLDHGALAQEIPELSWDDAPVGHAERLVRPFGVEEALSRLLNINGGIGSGLDTSDSGEIDGTPIHPILQPGPQRLEIGDGGTHAALLVAPWPRSTDWALEGRASKEPAANEGTEAPKRPSHDCLRKRVPDLACGLDTFCWPVRIGRASSHATPLTRPMPCPLER